MLGSMRHRVLGSLGLVVLGCTASGVRPPSATRAPPPKPGAPPTSASAASAPPSASSAAPRPLPRAPRSLGPLGHAGPLQLGPVSPDGGWLLLCQAPAAAEDAGPSAGPPEAAWLHVGDAPGERVDAVLAHDPTGRWLIVLTQGRATLRDAHTGAQAPLDADLRDDASPFRGHRSFAFDRLGQHLVYLRGAPSRAVVRTLASGAELTLEHGPGLLWRASPSADGRWVTLEVVEADSDGDGALEWPVPERRQPRPACPTSPATFATWPQRGDVSTLRVSASSGGPSLAAPGLVTALGAVLVVRGSDGQLALRAADGSEQELSPASCGARVLHADAARQRLLATCSTVEPRTRRRRLELELLGPGLRAPLGATLGAAPSDAQATLSSSPWVPVLAGQESLIVSLESGEVVRLEREAMVVALSDDAALLRQGTMLSLRTLPRGAERVLAEELPRIPEELLSAGLALVEPWVVDVATGQVLGAVSQRPLALAPDGRVLIALGGDPDLGSLAQGPLEWLAPAAPTAAPPSGPR